MNAKRWHVPLALFIPSALALVSACASDPLATDTLSFERLQTSLQPVDPAWIVATLSDDEARAVCEALPHVGPAALTELEVNAGYVEGLGGGGCVAPADGKSLFWVPLGVDSCVKNLRLATCQASVQALQDCVQYFASTVGGGSFVCADALTTCTPFFAAGGCDQTAVQRSFKLATPGDTSPTAPPDPTCASLPIAVNAVPPFACTGAAP